jgi:hypothetical protein
MNTLSLLSSSLAVHLLGCWLTGLGGQGEQQVPQLQNGHEGEAQEQANVPSQLQQFRNCDRFYLKISYQYTVDPFKVHNVENLLFNVNSSWLIMLLAQFSEGGGGGQNDVHSE